MAGFDFLAASVSLEYQVGTDKLDQPITKVSTYRNLNGNVTAVQLVNVCAAIASLTEHPLVQAFKTQKDDIISN